MRLYFLRHGHAEPGISVSDHGRQLTDDGIKKLRTSAQAMRTLKVRPSVIFSSPRVRAQQTAEIVADVLKQPVQITEEVNFGFDRSAARRLVTELPDDVHVMFVGHEPTFSMTIGAMTGASVIMKKGGLARVDIIDTRTLSGDLVWLIAPRIFTALGHA